MLNQIKLKLTKRFWRYLPIKERVILTEIKEDKFHDIIANFNYPEVNTELDRVNKKWPTEEFVVKIKQELRIEPLFGMGIHGLNNIDPHSVAFWGNLPSFKGYLKSHFFKVQNIKEAVIFDYNLGLNYFHFFNDVLPKLFLIDQFQLSNFPLLIHRRIYNSKHFQFLFNNVDFVNKRPWIIVEDEEYLNVMSSWHIKPMGYHKVYQEKIKNLVYPFLTKGGIQARIFLNRATGSGRNINNFNELLPILSRYGFDIIENESLTVEDQIAVFSKTSHLVSIHGAGITNILFSPSELRLLEIMPDNKIASHYYWLSCSLGINYYDVFLGGNLTRTNSGNEMDFDVDPTAFEVAIKKLTSK